MTIIVAVFVSCAIVPVDATADSNARVTSFIQASGSITALPSTLTPSLDSLITTQQIKEAQGSAWIKMSCSPQYNATVAAHPVPCWFGDPRSQRTVVLYGDSNAGNWIPTLDVVAKLLKYRLAVFAFPSCATPFIPEAKTSTGFYPIPFDGKTYGPVWEQCAEWHSAVGPAVAALNPTAVIAVSGPWMYSGTSADESAWISGFKDMYDAMTFGDAHTKRILLGTSPIMPSNTPSCLAEHPTNIQVCAETFVPNLGYYGGMLARDSAIAKATRATLVPVTPLFCYENHCSPVVKNYVVYVDQDHTTISYVLYLDGLMYSDLEPLIPERP